MLELLPFIHVSKSCNFVSNQYFENKIDGIRQYFAYALVLTRSGFVWLCVNLSTMFKIVLPLDQCKNFVSAHNPKNERINFDQIDQFVMSIDIDEI